MAIIDNISIEDAKEMLAIVESPPKRGNDG